MNQNTFNNNIYNFTTAQNDLTSIIDGITDYISVYPDGNHNFLHKWIRKYGYNTIQHITSTVMNYEVVAQLFYIDKYKILEFSNDLFPHSMGSNYVFPKQENVVSVSQIETAMICTKENIPTEPVSKLYVPPYKRRMQQGTNL
jgi:hypothetical protein